ncbi:DUF1484 domain-containing protein [Chromobacterium violaceum]|uniref:DUF1484 family protein n=1 Tax=Chromobacterium violaceum TaxID=536 RepID=UPI001E561CDE|nr:DUF1484 family protein [Chromobacterium violaceum]MCD0492384.1 DUF1484 domain-containing protein [Chromobacterium violaceum]
MSNITPLTPPNPSTTNQSADASKPNHLPATVAALVELDQIVAKLQNPLTHHSPTALRLQVERLAALNQDIEQALSTSNQTLARASEGMQSLLNLLRMADGTPLPARQLFSLLTPLHQEVLRARYQLVGKV